MYQSKIITIKSHLIQDYAQVPMLIRSYEPLMPLAEQQIIPLSGKDFRDDQQQQQKVVVDQQIDRERTTST